MIHTEKVKNSCVKVTHVHRILYHVVAEIVGLPMHVTFLRSAAGHPCGEATRMMVASVVVF